MSASAPAVGFDPDRTRVDAGGPATVRARGQHERGSLLAGKYRLEMLLGEGGMGFVWSAYNVELELPVAIKLLRAGLKNDRVVQRLRLEARAAARLVHPSIVRVLDIASTEAGDPFIVMELLTGENLADVLSRGRLSQVLAVQLLLPIADALGLSHAKGIVHRDLKPDNVFISTDGDQPQPKLLDFGIAKLDNPPATLAKLTEKGTVLGSPNYMSPEQVRGDDVDYRTDIWSFCVVLYKAITGTAPFSRTDKRDVMQAIMQDEPAPLPVGTLVDARLAEIIRWGLMKDPAARPASMRELGQCLAQWLHEQGLEEDAAGSAFHAKWLDHAQPALVSTREQPTLSVRASRRPARTSAGKRLQWALVTGVSMLLAGGTAAWAGSARGPDAHATAAAPIPASLAPLTPRTSTPAAPLPEATPTPTEPLIDSEPRVSSTPATKPKNTLRPRVTQSRLPF